MDQSLEQEIRGLYSRFHSHDDQHGRAFVPLADAYRRAGDLLRAKLLLEEGLRRYPDFASAHVVALRVSRDVSDHDEARIAAQRVLELDPDNVEALRALGEIGSLSREGSAAGAATPRADDGEAALPEESWMAGDAGVWGAGADSGLASVDPDALEREDEQAGALARTPREAPTEMETAAEAEAEAEVEAVAPEAETGARVVASAGDDVAEVVASAEAEVAEPEAETKSVAAEAAEAELEAEVEAGAAESGDVESGDGTESEATGAEVVPGGESDAAPEPEAGLEPEPAASAAESEVPPTEAATSLAAETEAEPEAGTAPDPPHSRESPRRGEEKEGAVRRRARPKPSPFAESSGGSDSAAGADIYTRTMARLYEQQGLNAHAIRVYERLVEIDPGDAELAERLEHLRHGVSEEMSAPLPPAASGLHVDADAIEAADADPEAPGEDPRGAHSPDDLDEVRSAPAESTAPEEPVAAEPSSPPQTERAEDLPPEPGNAFGEGPPDPPLPADALPIVPIEMLAPDSPFAAVQEETQ